MEEKYTIDDFANVLCLRNQLENVPINTLLDVYKDDENFITFLSSVLVLSETDSAFLLLDPLYMKKISDIINSRRWDIDDKEINKAINNIIGHMNEIKTYPNQLKTAIIDAYLDYHEKLRKVSLNDDKLFKLSLGYDAVVFAALESGDTSIAEEDYLFLISTNYLLETLPSLYENDNIKKLTIERIDKIRKKTNIFNKTIKTYSKSTKERLLNKKTSR